MNTNLNIQSDKGMGHPMPFTYPFAYTPHPLCQEAARQLITEMYEYVKKNKDSELTRHGKMFGVLIVARGFNNNEDNKLLTLRAFSGILDGSYIHDGFVPPIFNLQDPDGYFAQEEKRICALNDSEERSRRSKDLQMWLFKNTTLLNALGETKNLLEIFSDYKAPMTADEYNIYRENHSARPKPIIGIPPAGAGECCAPKLLQYAYKNNLQPLCMAEFWIGPSPHDEVRIEGKFYPSCRNKCRPILTHMLQGIEVEENPMLRRNIDTARQIRYLYEDDYLLVVCKPSGLLSSPGNDDTPSLIEIIREKYPQAMLPHRLDMDTSGIMVIAKDAETYKMLQQQFVRHEVEKQYIALLEDNGIKPVPEGTIKLPLSPNPFDRPRQMVNHEHGKSAVTHYKVLDDKYLFKESDSAEEKQFIKVRFTPDTGRTHQLRVHSAHIDGLARPIVGDPLYGTVSSRLYLHASFLSFKHPHTGEKMSFNDESMLNA